MEYKTKYMDTMFPVTTNSNSMQEEGHGAIAKENHKIDNIQCMLSSLSSQIIK